MVCHVLSQGCSADVMGPQLADQNSAILESSIHHVSKAFITAKCSGSASEHAERSVCVHLKLSRKNGEICCSMR